MTPLFDKRDNAKAHDVQEGDTLQKIADKYKAEGGDYPPDLSWEDVALFNWATSDPREVTRALFERVGIANPNALALGLPPENRRLDPARGKEILIPKLWKAPEGLDVRKTYTTGSNSRWSSDTRTP